MTTTVMHVEGMACEHCVKAVSGALNALNGVQAVRVDLKGKTVTVEHEPALATLEQMKQAVEDQGYDVV
ncbi:MAG TPA: copper chaperone CopZ [Candidatus Limiplasma sp.]|nr:copper chaperone CopZ [Candidatus Limiplasma sp.]